jgi:hypothetical protein
MSISRPATALLVAAVVGGCGAQGPSLAGYPGLQWEVISFYGAHATERSASCPNPQMRAVTRHRIVEETPEGVVMDVRYYWVDESQASDLGRGGNATTCQDWGERTFTFARTSDGGLEVQSMTGPQKSA